MFPKSLIAENKHKKHKRQLEIKMIINEMLSIMGAGTQQNKAYKILEFGSGKGFQIPYLKKIGAVTASDIYVSDEIKGMDNTHFVKCDIIKTPFKSNTYDIIFSNHVLEHIEDIEKAFVELKRIAKPGCLFAFSVPTKLWLLLSIPTQYYNKFKLILKKELRKKRKGSGQTNNKAKRKMSIFPRGHGAELNYIKCLRKLKISQWRKLFSKNGFEIIKEKPLLLYAPSEWPIIPTINAKFFICSSILFLLRSIN